MSEKLWKDKTDEEIRADAEKLLEAYASTLPEVKLSDIALIGPSASTHDAALMSLLRMQVKNTIDAGLVPIGSLDVRETPSGPEIFGPGVAILMQRQADAEAKIEKQIKEKYDLSVDTSQDMNRPRPKPLNRAERRAKRDRRKF